MFGTAAVIILGFIFMLAVILYGFYRIRPDRLRLKLTWRSMELDIEAPDHEACPVSMACKKCVELTRR